MEVRAVDRPQIIYTLALRDSNVVQRVCLHSLIGLCVCSMSQFVRIFAPAGRLAVCHDPLTLPSCGMLVTRIRHMLGDPFACDCACSRHSRDAHTLIEQIEQLACAV